MPRFSVIVPVYNVEAYLEVCVASVAAQPGPADWECILVDDGSTDTSGALCDALAEKFSGVKALHQSNGGLAAARNTGLAAAAGEWVLFLDSDDRWPENMLPRLRKALEENPGYDWFIGQYLEYFEADGTTKAPHFSFTPGRFESGSYAKRVAALHNCGSWSVWRFCIRREWLAETGVQFWPQVRWAEDWPFDLYLLHFAQRLCFVDVPITVYRVARQGSLLTNTKNLPARFASIAAAYRAFAQLKAEGVLSEEEFTEITARAADVFWPQARAAAVRDKEARRRCVPHVAACRPLYGAGSQCRGRADWVLYRWLLTLLGADAGLALASLMKR